ncbi:hypothetical protein BJX99DRAFT_124985 [Aspergillus californicus]
MSSVWNHAPNRSMVLSLRAAHFSSRSFRKGYSYSTSFRPIYPKSLDSPVNAFLCPSSSANPEPDIHGVAHDTDPSTCEFWCSSRLNLSRLNQTTSLAKNVPEPWGAIANRERDNHGAETTLSRPDLETTPAQDGTGKHQRSHQHSSVSNNRGSSKRPSNYEPTPSEYLIDTIQNTRLTSNKIHDSNWTFSGGKSKKPLMAPLTRKKRSDFRQAHRGSLQGIIADYIQYVDPVLQRWRGIDISKRPRAVLELEFALRNMPRDAYVESLASREYDISDVMAWAWVLKSRTAYEATLRIFLLEADSPVNKSKITRRIPAFIPLILLRQDINLKTFRLLLVYSLHVIIGRPVPPLDYSLNTAPNHLHNHDHTDTESLINPSMCATFVVRLLSHARRLWPEAQLPVAQALAVYLRTSKSLGTGFATKKLNMCLRLLSLPSGPRPFVSASVRQQAQFELLKAMADKHPASPVTRRGYQGMVAVQLAHKKTSAEREYAELKAPSWPPWKEATSGIDSQKGVDGIKSRAMRVMSQMREAGYPHSLWEKVTGILAGWDTDNSPTTQTRTLVRRPETLRGRAQNRNHRAIWEARIRSTRTVREAWACFLAYEKQGLPPHSTLFTAMGEKLVFKRKATKFHHGQSSSALPGDGLEVFPEPASARDWIYTPTEPPTLGDFLQRMLSNGIRPSGRFLGFLLHHAPTFRVGLDCLNCSDLTNGQLKALFTVGEEALEPDVKQQKILNELPEYLVSAFIRFLCRFAIVTKKSCNMGDITTEDAFPIITSNWAKPPQHISTLFAYTDERERPKKAWYLSLLSHAIRLLQQRDSQNPQGWIQLLAGLRSTRVLGDQSKISRHTQSVLAWHEVLQARMWLEERDIEMGSDGFQILCQSFSSAVIAGVKYPNAMEKGLKILALAAQRNPTSPGVCPQGFEDMVHLGLTTLKHQFDQLVLLDPKASSLFETLKQSLEEGTESRVVVPALVHVPSPAVLHAFVRSLGLAEDSDSLMNLLRWMSRHASALRQESDEYLNGDILMRRTLVALRIFLEGYWDRERSEPTTYDSEYTFSGTTDDHGAPIFSDPVLQEAYDIVTATEVWGPWPSDQEVWEYLTHGEQ